MTSRKDWATLEGQLRQEFHNLAPALEQWGAAVDVLVLELLAAAGFDSNDIKIPPKHRVKKADSFVAKALYREKSVKYNNHILDINDKVATRVVLLTTEQIQKAQDILISHSGWYAEIDKDISQEVELEPTSFGYQAAHIIVRQRTSQDVRDEDLLSPVACEIQLKTLFQHAYSEMSHSTVYKGPYRHETEILRKLARSMAMMEGIDEYFQDMQHIVNSPNSLPSAFSKEMIYRFGQLWPDFNKQSIDYNLYNKIFDRMYNASAFSVQKLDSFLTRDGAAVKRVISSNKYYIYHQPIIIFVAYLLRNRPNLIESKWDFDEKILDDVAYQMGISRDEYDG